jgi:hypothetical protein
LASGARLCDQVLLIQARDRDEAFALSAKRIGGPLLFGRLWESLGIADVLGDLLKERSFEFPVERAIFTATLHRLFVSGSDRDCLSWMRDYEIPDAKDLGAASLLSRHGLDRRGAGGEGEGLPNELRCVGCHAEFGREYRRAVSRKRPSAGLTVDHLAPGERALQADAARLCGALIDQFLCLGDAGEEEVFVSLL